MSIVCTTLVPATIELVSFVPIPVPSNSKYLGGGNISLAPPSPSPNLKIAHTQIVCTRLVLRNLSLYRFWYQVIQNPNSHKFHVFPTSRWIATLTGTSDQRKAFINQSDLLRRYTWCSDLSKFVCGVFLIFWLYSVYQTPYILLNHYVVLRTYLQLWNSSK